MFGTCAKYVIKKIKSKIINLLILLLYVIG